MKNIIHTTGLLFFLLSTSTFAQIFTSENTRTNLIELYTSEGCSSCPPADKWLNKLKDDPRLWSEFIPMAFHVNYWDYIGWKDPFANPHFSSRQRQYSAENTLSSVYTPGMLLNGAEWTSWRKHASLTLPSNVATGRLSVELSDSVIDASYQPTDPQQDTLILNIAILGFDLNVEITAGENKGQTLMHDFVVLGFHRVAMIRNSDGHYTVSSANLPELSASPSKIALSTWINNKDNLSPLQATGGWLN